jgi:hypothetical protein
MELVTLGGELDLDAMRRSARESGVLEAVRRDVEEQQGKRHRPRLHFCYPPGILPVRVAKTEGQNYGTDLLLPT